MESMILTENSYENIIQNRYSPDSLKPLRKELKDAIENIYTRFIFQFNQLKEARMKNQDPSYPISNDDLIIEKNYCNELTQKVKQLVHLDSLNDIYFTFCKSVRSFMSKINSSLQELKNSDPILQLACLAEGYFVIKNSYQELGKVTSGIFDQKIGNITCESVTKIAFFEEVVKNFSEVISACCETHDLEILKKVSEMRLELLEVISKSKLVEQKPIKKNEFLSPSAEADYCVDDIVSFINGASCESTRRNVRSRRVSKASTAETSGSPFERKLREKSWNSLEDCVLDKEVEKFQCVLESTKPLCTKFKPSLSEDWISKIREIIKNKHY